VRQTRISGGAPIAGATVNCPGAGLAVTGTDGKYTISDVAPGTYSCTASKVGFTSKTKSVTVFSGLRSRLNFRLAPA
jgi:hypothetical protein